MTGLSWEGVSGWWLCRWVGEVYLVLAHIEDGQEGVWVALVAVNLYSAA